MASVRPTSIASVETPEEGDTASMLQSGEHAIPTASAGFPIKERKSGIRQIPANLQESTMGEFAQFLGLTNAADERDDIDLGEGGEQSAGSVNQQDTTRLNDPQQLQIAATIPTPETIIAEQQAEIARLKAELLDEQTKNEELRATVEAQVQRALDMRKGLQGLHQANDRISAYARMLHERTQVLEAEKHKLERALQAKNSAHEVKCTCELCDFRSGTRRSALNSAARALDTAIKKAKRKERSLKGRRTHVKKAIEEVLRLCFTDTITNLEEQDKHFSASFNQVLGETADDLAKDLLEKSEVTEQDILQGFDSIGRRFKKFRVPKISGKELQAAHTEQLDRVKSLLKAERTVKVYLEKLIFDAEDIHGLCLDKVWQEKDPEGYLEKLGEEANYHCTVNFSPHKLDPVVEQTNDILELQKLAETIPTTEEKYNIWRDAIAKINVMHIIISVDSQVDFERLRVNYEHREKFIFLHVRELGKGKVYISKNAINFPGEEVKNVEDDTGGMYVASFEVSEGKTRESMIRKLMKRVDSSKNYEVSKIEDIERDQIYLTEEDSKDDASFNAATNKALDIINSWKGTNMADDRFRYSYGTGKTNPSSTGVNEACHVTTRDRIQCTANGKDADGHEKLAMRPREHQIKKYLPPHMREMDRDQYVANQQNHIRELAGINTDFDTFVKDLIHALHIDYDPPCAVDFAKEDSQWTLQERHQWSTREKMLMTLFRIIGDCDENGVPINYSMVKQICQDPYYLQQLTEVISAHKLVASPDEKSGYKGYSARYLQNEGRVKFSSINFLAAQAEKVLRQECRQNSTPQLPLPTFSP